MRLVVAGTPAVALPALDALAASRHEIVAVVTRPDAASGRGRRVSRSPVGEWADARGLPVLQPARPSEETFLKELADLAPDCCPVIAYGALVPRAAREIPRHGWVNLHFSVLPAWRGAAPVQRALMAGDAVTGATTFLLEAGLDTGPVFGVMTETVRPRDTAGDLLDRLASGGAELLVRTLDAIEDGTVEAVPQPAEGVSLAPKITVEEAAVDWSLPALAIDRRVRGCTPEPGAWTTFRGERLGIGPVTIDTGGDVDELAPGTLRVTKRAVQVGTGTVPVTLGEVRPAGKRPMPATDWARGARPTPTDLFQPPPATPAVAPASAAAPSAAPPAAAQPTAASVSAGATTGDAGAATVRGGAVDPSQSGGEVGSA